VLANVDRISGAKRQENLRAAVATVELSRSLVRLKTDVPIAMDWESWRLGDWDAPRLLALFQEWGFHRFADQVRAVSLCNGTLPSVPAESAMGTTVGSGRIHAAEEHGRMNPATTNRGVVQ